jgi:hypothetical protein
VSIDARAGTSVSVIRLEDARITGLRLRLRHLELGWRWIGAAGIIKDDVAYLLRRYDERGEEIQRLRATVEAHQSPTSDAPAASEPIGGAHHADRDDTAGAST